MILLPCFYAFMTALCASLIMVPFLRRWALDQGTVDLPDERKIHTLPIPRLGGIAIFLAFLFATLVFAPFSLALRGLLAGALIVFATGIADDLHGLSSKQKFLGQIIACLVTIAISGLWLGKFGDALAIGPISFPVWAGVPFTVFAVVGVTNAINLIDGLDGLAGGVSVLALVAYGLLGLIDGDPMTPLLAAALVGAILGFLKYNFYPARIFMGDTGSLTVGFVLGFLAIHLTQRPGAQMNVLAPVVILGLPIFDALWVMGRRLSQRTSPFAADKTHVHHKFLSLGFEHRFTVLVIYTISLFWACSALLLRSLPEYVLLVYLPVTAACFYLLLRHLVRHRDRYPLLQRDAEGGLRQTVLFNRGANLIDRIVPLLAILLAAYAVTAATTSFHGGHPAWFVALILLSAGILLRQRRSDGGGEFQMLLVYVACILAAFYVWKFNHEIVFGLSAKRCGDALLVVTSLIVILKISFRRPGEFFLATADFLALALMLFLAVASQQANIGFAMGGPLLRAILLMLAARTLASRGPATRRLLIDASLVLLAVFALSGVV